MSYTDENKKNDNDKVEPRYNEDLGTMETTLLWYRVSRYNQGKTEKSYKQLNNIGLK